MDCVLVLGDDDRSVLAIIRSLGRAGLAVEVVPFDPRAPTLASRYVAAVHAITPYAKNPEQWLRGLTELVQRRHYRLIIPCCERTLLPLQRHREQFSGQPIAMPDVCNFETLFDKAHTRGLAQRLGVEVAAGRLLTASDTSEALTGEFPLPVLIKPTRSYLFGALERRQSVELIETQEDLCASLSRPSDQLLIEQFVPGTGFGLSVLADSGEVVLAFQHRRLQENGTTGGSSLRISEAVDEVALAGVAAMVRELNLSGLAMFEFRRETGTNRVVLIEINARPWGSLPLAVAAGADFPLALYHLLVEGKRPGTRTYKVGLTGRNTMRDLHAMLTTIDPRRLASWAALFGRLGGFLLQPVRWALGREVSDTFAPDDWRPALAELLAGPRLLRQKRETARHAAMPQVSLSTQQTGRSRTRDEVQ